MTRHPRSVDQAIARFDEVMGRLDRGGGATAARRRVQSRSVTEIAQKLANIGMALGVLIAATIVFGLLVGPIGLTGLFVVGALMFLAVILFSVWPGDKPIVDYKEDMPNKAVVQRYIEEDINQGNLDVIDTLFSPEMREAVRGFATVADESFPDRYEEIRDLVAEGDTVMVHWIFHGTHQGLFYGIPPTGKQIEISGFGIYYL